MFGSFLMSCLCTVAILQFINLSEGAVINEIEGVELEKLLAKLDKYRLDESTSHLFSLEEVRNLSGNQVCGDKGCKERLCTEGPQRRYFKFIRKTIYSMNKACGDCPSVESDCFHPKCNPTNGVQKYIHAVNDKMPGPELEVCKGDTIVVDVDNRDLGLTVHWHGLTQVNTPYMDGVAFLTQCPIAYKTTFRYTFEATECGTHMWYSYDRGDGMVGSLIVHSADDPWSWLYAEDEYVIMLQSWINLSTLDARPGSIYSPKDPLLDAILINGIGALCKTRVARSVSDSDVDESDDTCNSIPLSTFNVQRNKNYRLRIINGGFYDCPLQFQIESHQMMLIAVDGSLVTPVPNIKTINMMSGESYDVIVNTNQVTASYFIVVKAVGNCTSKGVYQRGVLVYEGSENRYRDKPNPGYDAYSLGMVLNPLNADCLGGSMVDVYGSMDGADEPPICAYQLESLEKATAPLPTPVVKLNINFGTQLNGFFPNVNGKSLVIPKSLVLGTPNILDLYPELQCKDDTQPERCFNKIDIPLGATVDLTFIDTDSNTLNQNSFHLHGYKFDLLYQGSSLDDSQNDQFLNLDCPSKRDTVVVPAGGVARIRFVANNPGMWLLSSMFFRVRLDYLGMGVVLSVGTTDDLPPQPPNFPQCKKPNLSVVNEGDIIDLFSSHSSQSKSSGSSSGSSSRKFSRSSS